MWWSHNDLASPLHSHNYDHSPFPSTNSKSRKSEASHPWTWLFLSRGLNYYSSKETNNYVYLLGNPLLWWGASSTAVLYVLGCLWSVLKSFRWKSRNQQNQPRARFGLTPFYTIAPGTFCASWFIHYAPYFFISSSSKTLGSQLYLHNYLPSLYFSILLLTARLDRTWQSWSSCKLRYTTGFIFVLAIILSWYSLSPLAYGTDFSSRQACEKARSMGGWEFVCRRQNLPLARPQDAIAKIVVERRVDHEEHEQKEEMENSQFYYQAPLSSDTPTTPGHSEHERNHDHDGHGHARHDHDGQGEGEAHNHEGPFNEGEREHYDHEHFHHPSGHQHPDDDHHGNHHHGHGHAIHNPTTGYHHHHHHPQQAGPSSQAHSDPQAANDADVDKKQFAKQERMEKMFAAAVKNASNTLHQKEKLVAEKLALQARQRELDEQLMIQEQQEKEQQLGLERQQAQEYKQKEEERVKKKEEQERAAAAVEAHGQQVQRDREVQEQVRRAQEKRERERQTQEKEKEKRERLQREDQERLQSEEQERLQRETKEQQERQQREEQERQQREAQGNQERRQREEQEQRDREEQERQQQQQQREEQFQRDREAQELQLQQKREQAEQLERQAAKEAAAAAATVVSQKEEEEAKEKMTRQMLEEQVRILQAQVDNHHARSLNMATQQQQLQQH